VGDPYLFLLLATIEYHQSMKYESLFAIQRSDAHHLQCLEHSQKYINQNM